jgi:hypothetical protein
VAATALSVAEKTIPEHWWHSFNKILGIYANSRINNCRNCGLIKCKLIFRKNQ